MRLLLFTDSVDIIIDDRLLIADDSTKHHAFALYSFIVLHKVDAMPKYGRHFIIEFPLREALEEIASGVFEDARLNDEHARDGCLYDVHKS